MGGMGSGICMVGGTDVPDGDTAVEIRRWRYGGTAERRKVGGRGLLAEVLEVGR
jgi:hypothetical protein